MGLVEGPPRTPTSKTTRGDGTPMCGRAMRSIPEHCATLLTLESGEHIDARVLNISATGIAVLADFTSRPATRVVAVGDKRVLFARRFPGGAGFSFLMH